MSQFSTVTMETARWCKRHYQNSKSNSQPRILYLAKLLLFKNEGKIDLFSPAKLK